MQSFMVSDQVTIAGLAGIDVLSRYLAQIEVAVARNPRAPGFAATRSLAAPSTRWAALCCLATRKLSPRCSAMRPSQ